MKKVYLLASVALAGLSPSAWAQTAAPQGASTEPEGGPEAIADIVVTAERRSSNVQTTPLAISAIGGEALQRRQVNDVQALAQNLANVNFGQLTGNARIAIRGVGFDNISVGNEGRVAFHVDGVYVSRPSGALTSFYDIDRVEVVRGPQGTLYGRNATAGAVNVITRDPSQEFGGYLTATVGNYETINVEGAVGGALADGISFRLAGKTSNHGGYGKNITTGIDVDNQHMNSFRGKLKFELASNVDWVLGGEFVDQKDHSSGYHFFGAGSLPVPPSTTPAFVPKGPLFGGIFAPDVRDSSADQGPDYKRTNYSFYSDLHADLDLADLRFITGYRHTKYRQITDLDNSSAPLTRYDQLERSGQFSQEIRASKSYGWGSWLIGGYYFSEDLTGYTALPFDLRVLNAANPSRFVQGYYAGGSIRTEAFAGFGQLRLNVIDSIAVVLGGRYSTEKKSIDEVAQLDTVRDYAPGNPVIPRAVNGTQSTSARWTSFTPRATVEFKPANNVFLFATYSKGFKSGGFNLGGIQPPFRPEKITDYEIGLKTDWFDKRLRANVGAFIYDYTDLQVSKVNGAVVTIENAATARVKGIEAEIVALPIENLRLEASGALLDSRYRQYSSPDPARPAAGVLDLSGNKLTQSPKYTLNVSAEYTLDIGFGSLVPRIERRWVGRTYFTQFNTSVASQPSYHLTNAYVSLQTNDRWSITAFVKNIENATIISSALVGSTTFAGAPVTGTLEPPRTFGVQASFNF